VSLVFDEAPLGQVLQAMAEHQGRNMVMSSGIEGKLSLQLTDVPWEQAFAIIVKMANLSVVKTGNILQIQRKESPEQQAELIKQRANLQPLVQKVYTPKFADAEQLAASLTAGGEAFISSRGHITVDKRANRLLVTDNLAAQKKIAQWMEDMDIPLGQIELIAHIVTINQEALRELGVKWSVNQQDSAARRGLFSVSSDLIAGPATAGFQIGRIGAGMLALELAALEQQQRLEIVANPRLVVAHQQAATIKQGTEIPYQVSGGTERGSSSVAFKEAVLGMEVTPTIRLQGLIRLKLHISQNTPGRSIQHAGGEALAIDKQEIETLVDVRNGETLALGGIFQQRLQADKRSVPLLGEIPLLGSLFRYNDKKNERRELVVFITPKLLTNL